MAFRPVKGTRDFYPDVMRLRNWIVDTWRAVSLRNGFEEYDAPIFEYLDLFTVKSGEEIAEQLFSLTDRGGRDLAIRAEITPSLARMVNARINTLPRPIKWFSVPRLCRAERPQRGRLREFFQWNVDVIGSDDVLADAECILVAVDFLREVGLTPHDVQIRIGSRPLVMERLQKIGVADTAMDAALVALDKRPKIGDEAFRKLCGDFGLADGQIGEIIEFLDVASSQSVQQLAGFSGKAVEDIQDLWKYLGHMGVADYIVLDWHIVRGLAYYTGIVYEAIAAGERAVAGGGRYDNLLEVLGGPKVGGTGFGMGDVVLGILLEEKGKVPESVRSGSLDFFVIDAAEGLREEVIRLVGVLRAGGVSADFSYRAQSTGKQLKQANRRGAKAAVIIGPDGLAVKSLVTGEQADVDKGELMASPRRFLGGGGP